MDWGAWWAAVHGVAKSRTRLSDFTFNFHFQFLLSCIGEGNGDPLQCSSLKNPRDGGAWWAAVYGVAQSQTRLKWLSSSSSMRLSRGQETPAKLALALYILQLRLLYNFQTTLIVFFVWLHQQSCKGNLFFGLYKFNSTYIKLDIVTNYWESACMTSYES